MTPPPPPPAASPNDTYTSPLASRNASEAMLTLWSPRHKFNTWRRIWLAVAEAQHEVTKDWDSPLVTAEQVAELRAVVERGITDEEIARATELERELRHDVMSHVHCLGEQCPKAKGIIHLGMTSQDVVCNADLLILKQSLRLTAQKIVGTVIALAERAGQCAGIPTLGFTHYQSAQPTTVGRRMAGWACDLEHVRVVVEDRATDINMRGFRGATGTQASFLALLDGDTSLIDDFEMMVVQSLLDGTPGLTFGMTWVDDEGDAHAWCDVYHLTGQTYPRVVDTQILADLAATASVLHKIATDIRLLSNRKEIDEPFAAKQIGSSAMPYKRNPMRCERICGLARFVMNLVGNAYDTAATQWLERTLDDSSNRRLSLPEAFLSLDGALDLMRNVASGLVVHEAMIKRNLMAELPFLATENILMEAVKAGGDRQDLHERIRVHAQAAGHQFKHEGGENDLIERLKRDPAFASVHDRLTEGDLLDPMQYVGRSVEQTEKFIGVDVAQVREEYAEQLADLDGAEPRV